MLKMELEMLQAWVTHRVMQLRNDDGDRGSVTVEQAMMTAALVIAAVAVAALIYSKVTAKAESINLQ